MSYEHGYFITLLGKTKGDHMKKQFKQTKNLIVSILENYPQARNSDNYLYLIVIEKLGKGNIDKPIADVLLNLDKYGLPCFETVRRTRQKIQSERDDLKASEFIQDARAAREVEFRNYFGANVNG